MLVFSFIAIVCRYFKVIVRLTGLEPARRKH